MTLTKSWLQKQITDLEATRDEIPFGLDEDGNNTLATLKLALAGMEAEPVAYMYKDKLHADARFSLYTRFGNWSQEDINEYEITEIPLYTEPQPLTTSERAGLENYRNAQVVRSITQHFDDIALETAREIMCDVNRRYEFLGGEVQLLSRIQCRVDDACREAMLQGKAPQQLGGPGGVHAKVNNGHHVGAGDGSYGRAGDDLKSRGMGGSGCDNTAPQQKSKCWCRTCRPVTMTDMRFVVCPDCGNKRCPRANDCSNACTGSNEPGQDGSAYPAAPKEVL